jgi:hypothetical protein
VTVTGEDGGMTDTPDTGTGTGAGSADDREVIDAQDRPGEPAMSHLAPVLVALVEAGNTVTYPNQGFGFVAGPDGLNAFLDEPIDFDLIERRFVLPPTIHLDRAHDEICDDTYLSHVYGGDAQRRLRAAYERG